MKIKGIVCILLLATTFLVILVGNLVPEKQLRGIFSFVSDGIHARFNKLTSYKAIIPTLVPTISITESNPAGTTKNATPTGTPQPPTQTVTVPVIVPPTEITVSTPTLSVQTRLLPDGFAQVHIPAEQMKGVSFRTETKVIVVNGTQKSVTTKIPVLIGDNCNDFTRRDGVALVYLMSKRFGQSFKFTGPLIGSESNFIFYEFDGPNGECVANQNDAKAPADCAGQIYQSNGRGGETHPEFDLYPTGSEPRASLQDPVYCMAASMKAYSIDFAGNSTLAAANYKGYSTVSDPEFDRNYTPWFNAGGVDVDGVFVPFTDDENVIRSLLGPELDKWSASIEDFYSKMPSFYGHN